MPIESNLSSLVFVLISIVIALSVHEATHAFVGLKLGDTTAYDQGRVSFNPLDHIDPLTTVLLPIITLLLFGVPILAAKPVPFNPLRVKYDEYGAAMIAAAGPLSNLALAVIGAACFKLLGFSDNLALGFQIFTIVNIAIFVFNLVPIPPLDGSRVLYAFAPEGLQNFMAQIEQFGFFIIFGLILLVPGFSDILVHLNNVISNFLLYKL